MAENKNVNTNCSGKDQLAALAKARASMYRFLGGLYIMEVDKDQLALLKKLNFPEITGSSDADQDLRDGYALLRGYLAEFPETDADANAEAAAGANSEAAAGADAEAADGANVPGSAVMNQPVRGELSVKDTTAELIGKAGAVANKPEVDAKLDDLAADFAKVFLAAGDATGRAAFPYESVYVDKRHRVGGSTEMQMRALYLERGLEADPDAYRTMDDNIGLMLEYQGNVCEELAAALEAGDDEKATAILKEQKTFVKKHLTNWVYSFTADVIKYSERDFYKGVAKITNGFIKKEAELLKKGAAAWDIE